MISPQQDLLADISYDDELRFLKNGAFPYAELNWHADVGSIVRYFEDGMLFNGMRLTKGPWQLIKQCVSTGRTTGTLAACFETINREYGNSFKQLVEMGLANDLLADWVGELHSFTAEVETIYERDAMLADPVRAQHFADFLRSVNRPL
jgi:hypothetical protein